MSFARSFRGSRGVRLHLTPLPLARLGAGPALAHTSVSFCLKGSDFFDLILFLPISSFFLAFGLGEEKGLL